MTAWVGRVVIGGSEWGYINQGWYGFPYMLMLMFQVGDEPWALSTAVVKDLIPLVSLQSCPHLNTNVVGLLNYHGEHLPVVDVSAVVAKLRSPIDFSTRIAIVEVEAAPGKDTVSSSEFDPAEKVKLGLMLDGACETAELTKQVTMPFTHEFIQSMLESPSGTVVQQLALSSLLQVVS